MRRILIKALAAVTVFGCVYAMAATLGGIGSATLGADDTVVAACDTDGVTTTYTSGWDTTDNQYEVSGVTVAGVNNACDGQTLKVTLVGSGGGSLGEGTLTIPSDGAATTASVSLTPNAASKSVTGVHVTIG